VGRGTLAGGRRKGEERGVEKKEGSALEKGKKVNQYSLFKG
jgi:hypothetical protein